MFGFLKKKWFQEQPTIEAVQFPTFGWTLVQDGPPLKQWLDPQQTQSLTLNFFDVPPDLPTLKDVEGLRQFFRERVAASGGGILQVEVCSYSYGHYVKTLFKFPQDPSGMTYLGSLIFPFKDYSYVLKVQAMEVGTTGVRESVVMGKLLGAGELKVGEQGKGAWAADPYQPDFKEGTLMNLAEAEAYDGQFLTHPLSQVRAALQAIEEEMVWQEVVGTLAAFR